MHARPYISSIRAFLLLLPPPCCCVVGSGLIFRFQSMLVLVFSVEEERDCLWIGRKWWVLVNR